MRYEIFVLEDSPLKTCIRDDRMGFENGGNGGDCVCICPTYPDFIHSLEHWPENARRIVALLNMFDGVSTETLEEFAQRRANQQPMEIPGEYVQFSDDEPEFRDSLGAE